jgi:hypothetical protein
VSDQTRIAPAWVTWLLVIVGVVCLVVGIIYFTRSASALPTFFPGHDASLHRKHNRSGIGAIVLAVVAFAAAGFTLRRRA